MSENKQLEINLHKKQGQAWEYLIDDQTTAIGYGGGAGGGKSWLGCVWTTVMCLQHVGSRRFIARNELKRLKQSTLMTLIEDVFNNLFDLDADVHYKYNQQDSEVTLFLDRINDKKYPKGATSSIMLLDASWKPSDPMYSRFGSIELCGGFIDEANEIKELAFDILLSRCRYRLDDFGIIGKVLCTFNPDKGWVYSKFYKPYKDGQQKSHTKFIPSLATDNPHISKHYIKNLEKMGKVQKERLLHGNFDYDDSPGRLFEYDALLDMWTNPIHNGDKYISCDVARKGEDRAVIMVWDGWEIIDVKVYKTCTIDELEKQIKKYSQQYDIPMRRVIVDADGVGGGLVDSLKCKGFQNNERPIQTKDMKEVDLKPNYQNLKTQCYFLLADNYEKIHFSCGETYKQEIVAELDACVEIELDKDRKRKIIKKKDWKEKLGRSPDFADTLMMRQRFELQQEEDWSVFVNYYK